MTDSKTENEMIREIKKRNGQVTIFDKNKITNAIYKASSVVNEPDKIFADEQAVKVVDNLVKEFGDQPIPSVEDIQDIVEATLIDSGHSNIAKAYILYRHERRKIRDKKLNILNLKHLDTASKQFSINSLRVIASRYLNKNTKSEIIESPTQMFERVAILVGIGDLLYDNKIYDKNGNHVQDIDIARVYLEKLDAFEYKFHIGEYYLNKWHFRSLIEHYIYLASNNKMKVDFKELLIMITNKELDHVSERIKEYFDVMISQDFMPNSPTLMNAGCKLGQLSACFVLDMQDNMKSIMKCASDVAIIFQSGGGVGINYSNIRHEGDIVASTSGVASGPVSFMNIINTVTDVVKQGGRRRGANMGIMEVWHPDIELFITNKTNPGVLENFNVSVGVWEDFWDTLVNSTDGKYSLYSPRTNAIVKEINAHQLIDTIASSAWKSAEPGLIFFDNINKYNVFAKARQSPLRSTNPCGEQSLYPYESCNIGSINLANLVKRKVDGSFEFDWQRYEEIIRKTTRFLDNIIDVNKYPIPEIDQASKESRRIGLGVMGVADLLYKLNIPYNSKESYEFQSKLAEALTYYSMEESVALAKSRGEFPLCSKTEYPEGKIPVAGFYEISEKQHAYNWSALIEKIKQYGIRNVCTTTIAPTGTVSMIAECSNGMEPNFALAYEKRVTVGRFFYTNNIVKNVLKKHDLYNDDILEKIINNYGSMRGISEIPKHIQDIFVTAMDIHWADHLMAQSVWQMWIGNAIAKTINMPYDVTTEDVKSAYLLAHELGLKGITVYRDGSRETQVLNMTSETTQKRFKVIPSSYIINYIHDKITNEYIKTHVSESLYVVDDTSIINNIDDNTDEIQDMDNINNIQDIPKEKICPTCKNELTFSEGCHICLDCGYSGCTS